MLGLNFTFDILLNVLKIYDSDDFINWVWVYFKENKMKSFLDKRAWVYTNKTFSIDFIFTFHF